MLLLPKFTLPSAWEIWPCSLGLYLMSKFHLAPLLVKLLAGLPSHLKNRYAKESCLSSCRFLVGHLEHIQITF